MSATNLRLAAVPTVLYRHWARNGTLLYVGISCNESERRKTHRAESVWFSQVDRITLVKYPTRLDAENAERYAIINEAPVHNIVHAPWPRRVAAQKLRQDLTHALVRQAAGVRQVVASKRRPAQRRPQPSGPTALPWANVNVGDPCVTCSEPSQWTAQPLRARSEPRRRWVPLCTQHAVKEWVYQPGAEWFSRPRLVLHSQDMYVRPHDTLRYLVRLDGFQDERAWSFEIRKTLGRLV